MSRYTVGISDEYTGAVAITPHATTAIPRTNGITAGGTGTAAVRFAGASTDVTVTLTAGFIYPYTITHCRASGTTATSIVALYR
jgi:hypothetical protein